MSTTRSSPAMDSYAQQREFHRRTLTNAVRSALARGLPKEWRQRLRLRRRFELLREYVLDGVDWLLRRRNELIRLGT